MGPGAIVAIVFGAIFAIIILIIFIKCICVVNQSEAVIIQRLGRFHKTLDAGIHFLAPVIDSRHKRISLKEQVADFAPQPVITKDNVTMQIDTVVYFSITDPKLYCYGIENPMTAIQNLTATTLRNLIGELELDQTLTSRDTINQQMRMILDEATDPWGIKVNRVELKNILPPRDIQEAMEKQMRAEREKREQILRAEGEKQSKILTAQGNKEAMILNAEAAKISAVKQAEGEAEALLTVYEAQAKSIELINKANPSTAYLALKGFESYEKVANGSSTKIVVPTEMGNTLAKVTAITDVAAGILKEEKSKK